MNDYFCFQFKQRYHIAISCPSWRLLLLSVQTTLSYCDILSFVDFEPSFEFVITGQCFMNLWFLGRRGTTACWSWLYQKIYGQNTDKFCDAIRHWHAHTLLGCCFLDVLYSPASSLALLLSFAAHPPTGSSTDSQPRASPAVQTENKQTNHLSQLRRNATIWQIARSYLCSSSSQY